MLNPRVLRAALAILVAASSAVVAKIIEPPTRVLGESTTTIVVAEYKQAGPANRIVFSKVEVLQGNAEVPELIDIGKPDLREPLIAGKRYIIAYSPYAENRFEQLVVNPRGATFRSSPGIEPALWEDSKDNRALAMWRIDGEGADHEGKDESEHHGDPAREAMPRLLKMLRSSDLKRREFAAAEIALRPALVAGMDGSDQKELQRFVADDAGPDRARATLLAVAVDMPATPAAVQGWDLIAVDLLQKAPVKALGVGRRSALILAAMSYSPTQKRHADGTFQARWLHSDDQALVDAAANGLMDVPVGRATELIESALSDDALSTDSRKLLEGYLRRLELMTPTVK